MSPLWAFCLALGIGPALLVQPLQAQPANDNFANAEVIVGFNGMAGSARGDNFGASTEPDEPDFESTYDENPATTGRSVWYRWTAPTNGVAVFETLRSDFDTLLSVYTGDALADLTLIAGNNDVNTGVGDRVHPEWRTSFVQFPVEAGTTYHIRVASPDLGGGGEPGNIVLDWSLNGAEGTNLFAGQFRFATDHLPNNALTRFTTDDTVTPLYVYSENESLPPIDSSVSPSVRGARVTITRLGGYSGRVLVDYQIVPLEYTNIFITNCFGTNFSITGPGGYTNSYVTNCIVTNLYGNYTWFIPPRRGPMHFLTNVFMQVTEIVDENGNIQRTQYTTNVVPRIYPCENSDNPPEIIVDETTGETTTILSNVFCIQHPIVITNIPSFITNASPSDVRDVGRFSPPFGRLVFNDYQMSADLIVRVDPRDGPTRFYLGAEKTDAPPVNRVFQVNLTNVMLDDLESSDLLPPYINSDSRPRFGSAIVNVMENSIAGFDGWPTNAILNLRRATYRVRENEGNAVVYVIRTGTNNSAISVDYRVQYRSQNFPNDLNIFPLQAGSDYAAFTHYTNSPYFWMTNSDFGEVSGRLNWAANDFDPKPITIPIIDDDQVEFNEDIFIELFNPLPAPTATQPGAMLGNLGYFNLPDGAGNFANLTILFDDNATRDLTLGRGEQPAGAADRTHNRHNYPGSTPPFLPLPGANGTVMALVVQPDGRTIIAGDFTSFDSNARNRIARILNNGFIDLGFLAPPNSGANRFIAALALQSDGKIVAAGDFTAFNGFARNRVVRLNNDGSVDTTFNPGLGPNGTVWAVALQTDGKVVVGGDFTMVGSQPRNFVARLNADGTLDTTFDPGAGPNAPVQAVDIQADGKIVIGGEFTSVTGVGRGRIARLNADGSLDLTYDPGTGADRRVFAVKLQADGKALIGGEFTDVDQRSRRGVARLNTDGSLDTSFDPGTGTDDTVYTIALQSDGRILIGGIFTTYNETRRVGIARLYDSGALDTTFMDTAYNQFAGVPTQYHNTDVEPRNFILTLGVEPSGHVMIGGYFQRVGGGLTRTDTLPRRNVARLIGGETPGPGNIELIQDRYERDEDGVEVYVSLVRTNGDRGIASTRFLAMPYPPGPGAAPFTDFTLMPNYTRPFWDEAWPGPNPPAWGRTHADATWGPNFDTGPANVGTAHVFVRLNNNNLLDGDRLLNFLIYRPSGTDWTLLGGENIPFGVALIRRSAPMTIIDDDRRPGVLGFSLTNFVVSEAVGKALVTVLRTNGAAGTVTVNFRTALGGSATAGSDYAPTNGTLTFLPGEVTKNFEVAIVDDTLVESDERINLQLFAPGGGATLGLASSVITIVDNDYPGGRLNFSSASYVTNENARFAVITVTRTGGAAGTLSVQASTAAGGTATDGADYTSVSTTLVWNNGDTSPKTMLVPLLDDQLIEPNETINLRLSNATLNGVPDSMALGTVTSATLTLISDDALGTVGFSTASYVVNENGGPAYITVVRRGGSADTISVNYSVSSVDAIAGVDYVPTSGTLVFGPGEFSKTFTVQILDDMVRPPEGTRRFAVLLSGASPAGTLGSPASAEVAIIDDEQINEPPGEPDTAFRSPFSLDGPVLAMALQPDGKLVIAGDFTLANATPRNRVARINPDDSVDTGFSYAGPTAGANATVRALLRQTNGALVIGGDFTTVNGVNRNYIARLHLNGALDTDFNPGAGADNPVLALAETFVSGQRKILIGGNFTTVDSRPFNRIARLNDDGTPDLTFYPGQGANDYVFAIAVQPDGRVLIGGDFTSVNGVARNRIARLHPDGSLDLSFDPGSGANDAVRAIAIQTDGRIVIGGSFTNYNGQSRFRVARLLPNGTLDPTFDPGEGANDTVDAIAIQPDTRIVLCGKFTRFSSVTRNRVTRLNNDGSMDPTINFGTGANNFVAAALVQADGRIVIGGGFTEYDGESRSHLARIYGRSVSGSGKFEFASATFIVNENGTNALITVRRRGGTSSPPGQPGVTVEALTSDGTAIDGVHYIGGTFPLFFPAGEAIQTFQIPVLDDFEVNADRTVNLSLGAITPPGSALIGNQPIATLVILNDDAGIHFSAPTYYRNENAVDGVATISIVRSGNTLGTASITFQTTLTGTATPGVDFTPVFTNLTFNPGETVKNVTIPIANDTAIEGDETVGLQLLDPVGATLITPFTAALVIVDDDFGPGALQFAFATNSVAENAGFATIWIIRTNGRTGIVTADYFTRDITATAGLDYTAQTGRVVFNDGEVLKTLQIPILDDVLVEDPEAFLITLTNATGGAVIVGNTNTTVVIRDNDVGFKFGQPFYTVNENGGSVTISVLRINGSTGTASVDYTTADVTASAGNDYSAVSGTLSFADGETLKTVTVPILDDALVEGDEVFQLRLSNPVNGVLMQSAVPVTILDNDTGLRFVSATYSVNEGAGSVTLTVERINPNTGPVTVAFAAADDTAANGQDYTLSPGVLSFANGEASKTITIPIINDTLVEGDETFFVTLTNATGGAQLLGPSTALVTIRDNDAGLRFSSAAYSVSESGVQATITVQRLVITNSSVAVNYSTADGTATAGSDYVPASGTLTFAPGEVSKTFVVQIIDDTVIEGDETVLLRLLNPAGEASLQNPSAATLSILDNDGSLIQPAGVALISESGPVNDAIDPGETVTVLFALRNVVGMPTANLVATLQPGGGVASPSGPQNYGVLLPGGRSVSREFTFTAAGTNGGTLTATLALQDGSSDLGTAVFNFQLGTRTTTFTNSAVILINDITNATPYPSVISVSGVGGSLLKAVVTLSNVAHPFPDDVDVLLVGPTGTNVMLMSDCGDNMAITNVTLRFDDAAANFLPDSSLIASGTNKPTNYLLTDILPPPAPAAPFGSTLSVFNGSNPNGNWLLYVADDLSGGAGRIANGWSLTLTTLGVVSAMGTPDLEVGVTASPEPVIVTSNLTYTVTVTNHGPSAATNVRITNALPAGVQFLSAVASQGSISTNAGVVIWSVGSLARDAFATASIVVRPTVTGTITNTVSGFGAESDPNSGNNAASAVTTVQPVTADLALGIVTTPAGPVPLGQNLTYTLFITNLGPATATGVTLTNTLPQGVVFQSATPSAYVQSGGVVGFTNLGSLGSGTVTSASITVQVLTGGTLTNTATCASAVTDPFKANNTAIVKTEVEVPLVLFATVSGPNIEIAWPAAAANVTLERATNLTPPIVWMAVTNAPVVVGDKKVVTLPIGSGNEFFRLRPTP